MFRLTAFDAVGGYDPSVMAGEEPQLCLRLRHSHWTILRIDAEMTLHDAAITRFGQWWRRHVRAGYGTLDVNRRFEVEGERIFGKMVRSAAMWAMGWPAAIIVAGIIAWAARAKCRSHCRGNRVRGDAAANHPHFSEGVFSRDAASHRPGVWDDDDALQMGVVPRPTEILFRSLARPGIGID